MQAHNDIIQLIDQRNRAFERNYAARDAARLVADYFVLAPLVPKAFPPVGEVVAGHAALMAMFTAQFDFVPAIRLATQEVVSCDGTAQEWGRAVLSLASGDQALGRYAVLWRLIGDEWRAERDFFCQDSV